MRKIKVLGMILALFLTSVCMLFGDDSENGLGDRYILLATTRTKTMQNEIDAASQKGFRVLMGSSTSNDEMVLLLEKLATPENPFKYRLLATSRTGTMEKELNEGGENGYKMIPQTLIVKKQGFGGEIVVVMEKTPEASSQFKYRLLATSRTSTMAKEILEAEEEGYKLAGICSQEEHVVIMEKEIQ